MGDLSAITACPRFSCSLDEADTANSIKRSDIETTLCMATCLLLTVRAANCLSLMSSRKHAWNRCLMEWKWLHCNHSPRPQNREPGSMRKKGNERRGGLISSGRAYWGPPCRQQFNTRPCVDPAPGYELWIGSQALARASFLKLVAFPHFQLGRKPVSAKIIVCSGAGLNLYAVPITLITAAHHFSHTGKPNSGWPQKEHHRLCD